MNSLVKYVLVILLFVKIAAPQCIGSEDCECHCYCCSYPVCTELRYCTSCAKGWSGTTNNGCQRQNVAYNATANSTSIFEDYFAKNAVDEDSSTYALTNKEDNPRLTLTLSNVFKIKNIFMIVYAYRYSIYNVFVTNSESRVPSDENKCISVPVNAGKRFEGNVSCNRILTGNQIVIQIASTSDALLVYEVKVYQCSQGTYGDLCEFKCINCVNNRCDGYTGVCESGCNIGWQGEKCDANCNSNCIYKTCNQDTGFCTYGCKPGWYGDTCTRLCPSKCESPCDRSLGCTNCQIGYNGPYCNQCYGNTYGKNCSLTCQNCMTCNNVDGCRECLNGFYGDIGYYLDNKENSKEIRKCLKCPSSCVSCDSELICTKCIPNLTGNQCENECNINCVDGVCELNGTCTNGCSNSKHGVGCTDDCKENCVHCYDGNNCSKCLPGYHGRTCTYECYQNCFNCTKTYNCETCKPGFYGSWCNNNCLSRCLTCDSRDSCTSCKEGWSGQLCQCSEHCEYEDCDDNGICQSGCKGSYHGERCDVPCPSKNCQRCEQLSGNCTECSEGLYGINCTEKCNGSCLGTTCDMTGACLKGCVDGFAGIFCTKCE